IFDQADEVEVIDIPPDELLKRLAEGKVYTPDRSQFAVENFFRKGNLTALREMSLRLTAERVDHQLRDYMQSEHITETWKSGQRLLLGISASPSSVSVIRWARRMAYTMNATWIAVYVESSKQLSDHAKKQLNANIKLAQELGAEIITTADENIASALVREAKQHNATQILVGKTTQRRLFSSTLMDDIIEYSGNLDVYVVGEHNEISSRKKIFSIPEIHSGISQYVLAVVSVFIVALACYALTNYLGYQTVALILLLTVALLPLKLGVGPVLVAATLSALVWDFFVIPPRFTIFGSLPQDIAMLIIYFAIATITSVLTTRIRAREKSVRLREEHSTALFTLTRQLTATKTQDEVAETAVNNIANFFNSDVALFLSQPDGDIFTIAHPKSTYAVNEKEFGVAAWVYWNEKKAGKFTDTLPSVSATYYPISGPRYPLGVIGVRAKNEQQFSIDQESLLQNFIAQIASTLEREQLNELTKQTIVYAESEKLYKTLFNSISHELRTPIAAIVNASEALNNIEQKEFLEEIRTAADRLNRLVENLLDMARLESGLLAPKKDWCNIRDIVNTSLKKLQKELSHHKIIVTISDNIPLVKLDFGLIEQAVTNLLHNASQYTPSGTSIEISAEVTDRECVLAVRDHGSGFSKETQKKIFEKFYRAPGTKTGGTGLGLSIVKGFIEAHKGTITAANHPGGGALFEITIPIREL
ncbi:MAG: ATP-binding protein, partial [Bacteroidota bacterium]|nr:ATP-binding protein [Bacteroidota bacterium]